MDNIIEHYISIFYGELDYLEFPDLDKDKRNIQNNSLLCDCWDMPAPTNPAHAAAKVLTRLCTYAKFNYIHEIPNNCKRMPACGI